MSCHSTCNRSSSAIYTSSAANLLGDGSGWSTYDDGRDEAVKKAFFNQALSYMVVGTASNAFRTAVGSGAPGNDAQWNTAWALYGFLNAPSAGSTPYATANKRCQNYGTCSTTAMAGSTGEAQANVLINDAFKTRSEANLQIIKDNIAITYIQASLRYANKIDKDVTTCPASQHLEHQGEGQSFGMRLLQNLPSITLDTATNDELVSIFMASPCDSSSDHTDSSSCRGAGGRYCRLLPLLTALVPTGTELGSMVAGESPRTCPDDAAYAACPTPEEAAVTAPPAKSSASAAAAGFAGVVGAMVAALGN